MKFKTKGLVKAKGKYSTYCLKLTFTEGKDMKIYSDDMEYLTFLVTTYKTYLSNLGTNWNSFCDIDYTDVFAFFKEANILLGANYMEEDEDEYDFVSDYWNSSHDDNSNYLPMLTEWNVSYFDEDGLEYLVEVI